MKAPDSRTKDQLLAEVRRFYDAHLKAQALILQPGLRPYGSVPVRFARGGGPGTVYIGEVDRVNGRRRCQVAESNLPNCLLGTAMLDGCVLQPTWGRRRP
jgi:hypothetical protein